MRGEFVALDLETTGLDPAQDTIIEVGAVRMRDGEILDEFSTLVNPDRPIPQIVTQITGIDDSHVRGAPYLASVLPAIRAFAGNAPIVGHNVSFDTAFLYKQGLIQNNLRIDTYELASVLMPNAPRYTLSSLANQINIDLENAHRALDDARATGLLYWMLWQKALTLPYHILQEIAAAAQGFEWDARATFEAALHESARPTGDTVPSVSQLQQPYSTTGGVQKSQQKVENTLLDTEQVIQMIQNGGVLSQHMADYEERAEQINMTRAVVGAFNESQQVMIEAGTGTGKSIAYLLPALMWATQNQEQVVVSTNTINLQEQLINKDIPDLAEALNIPFRAAVLKGRGNYLCPRRLTMLRRRRPTNLDELRVLAKILVWMLEEGSGDKSDISLRGPAEHHIWQRLSAEDEHCTPDRCEAMMQGICPFYRARQAAENAHLLIVNHALLLADATSDNNVLPDYQRLVVDEGHHLEEAATNSLSFRIDDANLKRRLADLGSLNSGMLGDMLNSTRGVIPDKDYQRMELFVTEISKATGAMEVHIRKLFGALNDFVKDINGSRSSDFNVQLRMTREVRGKSSFSAVQAAWKPLQEFFEVLSGAMLQLAGALNKMQTRPIEDHTDLISSTNAAARHLVELSGQLKAFLVEPDDNFVYWIGTGQNPGYLSLQGAPLHIGPMIEKIIWQQKSTVIMTSATLQTDTNFKHIRERLHGQDFEMVEIGSPFNFQESTLVFVPNDMPEPNEKQACQEAVERGIIELAAALDGRVLVLFTSYTQLRQTSQAISPRLALGNITVYDQSDGSNRQALLDGFKSTQKAVLLGTKSFWEGVDVPGGALSAVVITRLPFAVPTEPIFAARSETYKDSFNQYALPDAILRFRQGFGRLIRTKQDRGIVAIFDRRIISKGYGADFLGALPECTVEQAPLRNLPTAAKTWLEKK